MPTGWCGSVGIPTSLPPTAWESLGVREPGRQQVLEFPREVVVPALACESHPGGLVSVPEPRDLLGTVLP